MLLKVKYFILRFWGCTDMPKLWVIVLFVIFHHIQNGHISVRMNKMKALRYLKLLKLKKRKCLDLFHFRPFWHSNGHFQKDAQRKDRFSISNIIKKSIFLQYSWKYLFTVVKKENSDGTFESSILKVWENMCFLFFHLEQDMNICFVKIF